MRAPIRIDPSVRVATARDVQFYGCLILAVETLPHWGSAVFFIMAGWTLFKDLRDGYRWAERQHKQREGSR